MPRHALRSLHNIYTLWKTIHGLANKYQHNPKQHSYFYLTHTNSKCIEQIIHQYSQTENTQTTDNHNNTHHNTSPCKNNNSAGPDEVNIRHLKQMGPLGLAYLTNMYNISLHNNIIPHICKLHQNANHTLHSETKHQHNVNSKLVFHKAASYHPHYSIYMYLTLIHHRHQ